jgi:hypothetical protein
MVYGVGLGFPVLDVGVYESFLDGECGNWKLVEIGLYRIVGGLGFGISVFLSRLRSRREVRLGLWRVLAPLVLRGVCSG